jgi:hypothetical protein
MSSDRAKVGGLRVDLAPGNLQIYDYADVRGLHNTE